VDVDVGGRRLRVVMPEGTEIKELVNLDEIYDNTSRADLFVLLEVEGGGRSLCIFIEDTTGIPELRDVEKLENTHTFLSSDEKYRSALSRCIIIKILHHGGKAGWPLVMIAKNRWVELEKCGDTLDIGELLRRRGWFEGSVA